jgi:hypothetical protein
VHRVLVSAWDNKPQQLMQAASRYFWESFFGYSYSELNYNPQNEGLRSKKAMFNLKLRNWANAGRVRSFRRGSSAPWSAVGNFGLLEILDHRIDVTLFKVHDIQEQKTFDF